MKPRKYLQGGAPVHELSWFVTGGHDLVGWRRHQKVLLKCTKAPSNIVPPDSPVTSQPFYRRRWWLTLAILGETMGWHAHSFRTIGDAHLHKICPFEELYIHCADVMAVVAQFGHLLPEKETWESRVAAWSEKEGGTGPCKLVEGEELYSPLAMPQTGVPTDPQTCYTISYNFIQFQMRTHPIFWTENFETYLSAPSFFFPAQSLVLFAEAEAFAWGLCKSNIMFALFGGSSFSFSMQGLEFCRSELAELEGSLGISHHDPSRTVLGGPESPAFETESNWIQLIPGFKMANNTRRGLPWAVSRKTSRPWADCAGSWQLYTLARMVVGPWCRVQSSFMSSLPIHHECCVGVSENGDTHKRLF